MTASKHEDRYTAKELYRRYAASLVPVISIDGKGDQGIGSAFHVGDGSFVTARHVVEGMASCHVEVDRVRLGGMPGFENIFTHEAGPIAIDPKLHPDIDKDVAVFSVPRLSGLPAIQLGRHLDDWIAGPRGYGLVLDEVLVLGFPPIPLSQGPILVAARAQINALADLINLDHVHFVVSATARGGFSGGVALQESGFALGVVTASLLKNNAPEELGYFAILTIQPILECLAAHGLLPRDVAIFWDGQFTARHEAFVCPGTDSAFASIRTDRDGHRARVAFLAPNKEVGSKMADTMLALKAFAEQPQGDLDVDDIWRFMGLSKIKFKNVEHVWQFTGNYADSTAPLEEARKALRTVLLDHGYQPDERGSYGPTNES
jgi:hypothetical protein